MFVIHSPVVFRNLLSIQVNAETVSSGKKKPGLAFTLDSQILKLFIAQILTPLPRNSDVKTLYQ